MLLARIFRYTTLVGLLALIAGVAISLRAGSPPVAPSSAVPESNDAGPHPSQQATQVEMVRTRRAAPTVRLQASESVTYDDGSLVLSGVTFFLFDADGAAATVEAPRARSTLAARVDRARASSGVARAALSPTGSIGAWTLDGGVTVTAHGDLLLKTPSMTYDEADGVARTAQPVAFTWGLASGSATGLEYVVSDQVVKLLSDVTASMVLGGMGRVRVEAQNAQHDLGRGRFAMQSYRANTERGETLSGARLMATFGAVGGLQLLQGDGGFVLESTHAVAAAETGSPLSRLLALEGRRTMEGQRITVGFGTDSEPTSVEVFGQASLTADDAKTAGSTSSIEAETLAFDLIRGSLTRARAIGGVDLKGAPGDGESTGFHLQSENLDAVFDPNRGLIQRIEGAGSIQLHDEGMQSRGSRTFLDPNTDIVTLAGETGSPASATWLGRKIEASRIEADRKRKTLSARGGVRASFRPSEGSAASSDDRALPFFRGGEMIYAMADTLVLADEGRSARYRDRVRIWQGENRLEAVEVDLNEASGGLEARGDIINTFRQPAPQGVTRSGSPSEEIVTVAASTMRYDRAARRIVYGGRVAVTQGPLWVACESLVVTLAQSGSAAERMEAEGSVEVRDGGRNGRADRLVVDPAANTITMMGKGREAIVQDESGQQVVRGRSLTMDRASDRILVESELGGRTWITLKPRQKGAPGVGSDPHN